MIAAFIALTCGHMLADFVFQTNGMADGKKQGALGPLALHIAIVGLATLVTTGAWHVAILAAIAAHLAIDLFKIAMQRWLGTELKPFLIDQALHLISLFLIASHAPGLWEESLWHRFDLPQILTAQTYLGGLIATVIAGGYAVKFTLDDLKMAPQSQGDNADTESLAKGGETIGRLERLVIFLLVLTGQAAGVGFLIAAKSILRFETNRNAQATRPMSEYIIIGTLASFGWALMTSWGTREILDILALGIAAPAP